MGAEGYQYLATLDLKTCEGCCRDLDRETFPVRDRQDGVNCPPMHPWCRCTRVSAIPEELAAKLKRRARDPVTGRNMLVPMAMTYQQWRDKYVKGNPDAEFEEKKAKALSADKAQHERYKRALGRDNIPKTLDGFQNMKYTESEKWREAKEAYRDVNWQREALKNHKSGEVHSPPFNGEPNSVFDNYKEKNPNAPQSVLKMIPLYVSEGTAEGIRGDVAFAQSCLETGNFTFKGSAVTLGQNNFCGMGVTASGMKGNPGICGSVDGIAGPKTLRDMIALWKWLVSHWLK